MRVYHKCAACFKHPPPPSFLSAGHHPGPSNTPPPLSLLSAGHRPGPSAARAAALHPQSPVCHDARRRCHFGEPGRLWRHPAVLRLSGGSMRNAGMLALPHVPEALSASMAASAAIDQKRRMWRWRATICGGHLAKNGDRGHGRTPMCFFALPPCARTHACTQACTHVFVYAPCAPRAP